MNSLSVYYEYNNIMGMLQHKVFPRCSLTNSFHSEDMTLEEEWAPGILFVEFVVS